MTPVLVAVAVLVGVLVAAGAAIAVTAREPRVALLGLVLALAGAPFVADPAPSVVAQAGRVVAAILAGYVLWVAVRRGPSTTDGSHLGWPGVAAVVIALLAAGWLAAGQIGQTFAADPGVVTPAGVPVPLAAGSAVARAAFAAGITVLALSAAPVLVARDVLRLGIGLLLLLTGVGLVDAALEGQGDTTAVVLGSLTAAVALALAGLVVRALALPAHDLEIEDAGARDRAARPRAAHETGAAAPVARPTRPG